LILDINAFLGTWPFRKLRYSGIEGLNYLIARAGVNRALVSPFESLFYKSNDSANCCLQEIEGSSALIPVAAINPTLPNVQSYLRDLIAQKRVRAFKLHPDYHGYGLNDDLARPIYRAAEDSAMPVIVPLRMSDERSHHWAAKVPPTPAGEVTEAAKHHSGVKFIVCNARSDEATVVLKGGTTSEKLYLAISWAQMEGFIASAVNRYGPDKIMWGSNMPLHYPETTLAQIKNADITTEARDMILSGNPKAVFGL
jgi:hypothetical protein